MSFETLDIERHLLKILTNDKMRARAYLFSIKDVWFTGLRSLIFRIVHDLFKATPTLMTTELFEAEICKLYPSDDNTSERTRYLTEWTIIQNVDAHESIDALIDKLKEKQRINLMSDICAQTLEKIQKGDIDQAAAILKGESILLDSAIEVDKPLVDLTDLDDLHKYIEDQKLNPGKYAGIKTGFRRFDYRTGGLFKAEFTLVAAVTGVGKCSTENTKCYTKKGTITLKQIFDRHINYSSKYINSDGGEWYNVIKNKPIVVLGEIDGKAVFQRVKRMYRERTSNVVNIGLRDNSELEAGLNHGYLTPDGWKLVKDLKANRDWVAVSSKINVSDGEKFNPDLVEFLAWNIAEGAETSCNRLSITQDDLSVLNDLWKKFNSFGFKCSGYKYDSPHIRHESKNNSNCLFINSKEFKEYLKKEFDYEYGIRSGEKIIPIRIQNSDQECVRTFLRAYFDAEGCVNINNIELSSKSREIIEALRYMLRRFGILVITSSKLAKTQKGMERYWRINIGGKYACIFRDEIGFGYQKKQSELIKLCDRKCNTNVGNSVPCYNLLKELVDLSGLQWVFRSIGLGGSYHSKKFVKNPSKDMIKKVVCVMDNIIKNHWDGISNSSRKIRSIDEIKKNKSRIVEIVNMLRMLSSDDILWLEVTSIKKKKCDCWLYDLEIDGEPNYVLDLAFSHNSTFLKQLGYNIARGNVNDKNPLKRYAGKNVLHVTNEEHRDQVRMKYSALFSDLDYFSFKNATISDEDLKNWRALMLDMQKDQYGRIFIKEIPQFADSGLIYRSCMELKNRGFEIDVILLDYLDHLAPMQKAWSEYDSEAKVAWDVKGLAIDLNLPVVAATQAGGGVVEKQEKGKRFGKLDVYGSRRKVHIANTFIGIMLSDYDATQLASQGGDRESDYECDKFLTAEVCKSRDGALFSFTLRHKVKSGRVIDEDWLKGTVGPENKDAVKEEIVNAQMEIIPEETKLVETESVPVAQVEESNSEPVVVSKKVVAAPIVVTIPKKAFIPQKEPVKQQETIEKASPKEFNSVFDKLRKVRKNLEQ